MDSRAERRNSKAEASYKAVNETALAAAAAAQLAAGAIALFGGHFAGPLTTARIGWSIG